MPKQINTYRFGQALVRMFGLKGRFQPVLDETIVPVVLVGGTPDAEIRLAIGGQLGTAPGAGSQRICVLSNPADSGVLVTVTRWWAVGGSPLADYVEVKKFAGAAVAAGRGAWRDTRLAGLPKCLITFASGATAVLGPVRYHLDIDSKVWEEKWVLEPNTRLEHRLNTANQTLDVTWAWEETDLTATVEA